MREEELTEKLINEYKTQKSKDSLEKLIELYIPLVKYIAGRLAIGLPSFIDYDDLVSLGMYGLLQALERFDPAKGVKFETFAFYRIKGAITDGLRKMNPIRNKNTSFFSNFEEISSDEYISEGEEHYGVMLWDLININKDLINDPQYELELSETKKVLAEAIGRLPEKEKIVVSLYYYDGLTLKEISRVLDLTPARISQLHSKAIRRLRGYLSRKKKYL
ncbi:RNA polymerase sigma-D factor [Thermovenabulum gondwanense]|uniref:RNA polymerase sigma-D factor n=1 Tax=Thermovenabulum gondwanense TaxID=520767 RepID=A0A162M8W5_9FIRM|nr:sigma-70 family RNA polymerase sigma factor [Thermovenabulum gondwanense]KYO64561.1 RNA polymerase sigma-D factor [Thermovenabulum gondwanense]